MFMKCIKVFVVFLFLFLALGIYVHYDLIQEQPRPEFICYKGKLIRAMEEESIYLKVKDTQCEVFENLIIIDKEVKNDERHD